ncbi:methanogenesis marker 9 domain-containing protein [Methanofollis formosanus]|uniref:Methanogenesis marker 9 domain-containing protein n=1 Tax=Methanofollis formosanus TaxID=299308 RepID=A0A8G1A1E4_9EURY|nr:methanogenesis marker 9 domain-containing protein [Methanofollis formosanus]QYZ78656.1 methanogenesis marker 9 domain-containing protein [Methanofollis formosanus]
MIEWYERCGLILNGQVVKTPVVIASMAGITDAAYVLARKEHIGAAFIGGYSIDAETMEASRAMAAGGRDEFVYDDPVAELKEQVSALEGSGVLIGLNLRGSTPASYAAVAEEIGDGVVYEIDAHCRQPQMTAIGCGEALLHEPHRLAEIVRALKALDVTVSVKMRAGVAENDAALARLLWKSGADLLHVDLMDFGYARLRQIRNACPLPLIANNSITSFDRAMDMFAHGADMVSLARRSDERTLAGIDAAICRRADETGWYNAPKQLCRGGDIRSLTFCCLPVKHCPLLPFLERLGLTREEYMAMKAEAVADTPLADGKMTCFGSMAWCCKSSSPCMLRGIATKAAGISDQEYMRLKRRLADEIMERIFDGVSGKEEC